MARIAATGVRRSWLAHATSSRRASNTCSSEAVISFNDRPKGERMITIDCAGDESCYRLVVRDNGIGIDPRYAGQIFDLGMKLDKSRGGGPGYGLFLAQRMAEAHGGSISVESAPEQGSTFSLTIPTAPQR